MVAIFDYSINDEINPLGTNDLSPLALFYQRSLYSDAVYPDDYPTDLDTWYGKSLYGRVDNAQNTIMFNAKRLRPVISAKKKRVYAADFVVESFEAFARHMKTATTNGLLAPGSNEDLRFLMASEGWVCPEKSYGTYIEGIYEGMLRYYMPVHNNKIKNFETFVPVFKQFLKDSARILPITITNFLLTGTVNPQISGITIKIGNYDCGNDKEKFRHFVSDPNFAFYRAAAKKFGFIVNKNAPWILTADLFSPAMLAYVGRYTNLGGNSITKRNFFSHYYNPSCLYDIANLKEMFINFYNKYIDLKPFYQEEKITDARCPNKTAISEPIQRFPDASLHTLSIKMLDFDWISFYIDLRTIEQGNTHLNKEYMVRIARDVYDIKPIKFSSGLENAIIYINSIYKRYVYPRSFLMTSKNIKPLKWKHKDGRITHRSLVERLTEFD